MVRHFGRPGRLNWSRGIGRPFNARGSGADCTGAGGGRRKPDVAGGFAVADFCVTRANLARGGKELNPVTRVLSGTTAGLATNFALETGGLKIGAIHTPPLSANTMRLASSARAPATGTSTAVVRNVASVMTCVGPPAGRSLRHATTAPSSDSSAGPGAPVVSAQRSSKPTGCLSATPAGAATQKCSNRGYALPRSRAHADRQAIMAADGPVGIDHEQAWAGGSAGPWDRASSVGQPAAAFVDSDGYKPGLIAREDLEGLQPRLQALRPWGRNALRCASCTHWPPTAWSVGLLASTSISSARSLSPDANRAPTAR